MKVAGGNTIKCKLENAESSEGCGGGGGIQSSANTNTIIYNWVLCVSHSLVED